MASSLLTTWLLVAFGCSAVWALTFQEKAQHLALDATWIDKNAKDVVDLLFVVDESDSVGAANFEKSKMFIRNFVDYFSIAPGHGQVGLVKFGNAATSSIVLKHDNHKCALMNQLSGVRFGGGGTNAKDGLDKANLMLQQIGRKRTGNAFQVVVFMTDGDWNSGGDPGPTVTSLKAQGVLVIVVTVGRISRKQEMIGWASNDVKGQPMFYDVDNFQQFRQLAHYLHRGGHTSKYLPINKADCGNKCSGDAKCMCDTLASQGVPKCACEPGWYRTASGNLFICTQCPVGQYQHEINIYDKCRSCPTMQTTISRGSTASSQCVCAKGYWNPSDRSNKPPCTPITCQKAALQLFDLNNVMLEGTCSYKYNTACDYECKAGFISSGIMKRTCLANGNMDPPLPKCHALVCPKMPKTPHSTGWVCKRNGASQVGTYPYRTQCLNRCQPGYRVRRGTSQNMMCTLDSDRTNGKWSGKALVCEPITCGALPEIANGQYSLRECSHPDSQREFGQQCTAKCYTGFRPTQDVTWECQADGNWDNVDKTVYCDDVTKPTIVDCPQHVRIDNSEGLDFAKVRLVPPQVFDNYKAEDPEIVLRLERPGLQETYHPCNKTHCSGPKYHQFPIGDSTVGYIVTDRSGNEALCTFEVTVKDIEPPTVVQCNGPETDANGFIYSDSDLQYVDWLVPEFADNSKKKLDIFSTAEPGEFRVGKTWSVTYQARDAAGHVATCSFSFKLTGMKCKPLQVPINGAMVCDKLAFGIYCVPHCEKGLQRHLPEEIPFPPRDYVCTNKGEWRPHNIVGHCTIRNSLDEFGDYEFTWYEGNCNDEDTQETIIKNTIEALKGGGLGTIGIGFHQDATSGGRPLTTSDFTISCGPKNESIIQIGGGGGRYKRSAELDQHFMKYRLLDLN